MITDKYVFFWGGTMSQWHASEFEIDGQKYTCAEQYMMYKKASLFEDEDVANAIMRTNNPREQKALGRKVRGFDKDKWEEVCKEYVYEANYAKFTQNPHMLEELKTYGNREIVESSPEDSIWGIGMHENHPDILDKSKWQGKNWLGQSIMRVRDELLIESVND
jgi:ribA/ribD-fused uncharacterized protein